MKNRALNSLRLNVKIQQLLKSELQHQSFTASEVLNFSIRVIEYGQWFKYFTNLPTVLKTMPNVNYILSKNIDFVKLNILMISHIYQLN